MGEISVAVAMIHHDIRTVDINRMASVLANVSMATLACLQLVIKAVSKNTNRAIPVVARCPLGIYAINPRWLEALQSRLYLRSVSRSLFATDYFRIIAIPGALARAVSRPRTLAAVKKPLPIRRTSRLVGEVVMDGGDLAVTVFVYNINARSEKMLLTVIRVSGIPCSLFAIDHFRMLARPPATLMPRRPVARAKVISHLLDLALVKTTLDASRIVVKDNVNISVNACSPRTLFATGHFQMINQHFANLAILVPLIGLLQAPLKAVTGPTVYDEAPQSAPVVVSACSHGLSVDWTVDTCSYVPTVALLEDPVEDAQPEQLLVSAAPVGLLSFPLDISIDSVLEMVSPLMDYDTLKPHQLFAAVAYVMTSDLSVEIIGLAFVAVPFDLDIPVSGASSFIEVVDDDIVKRKSQPTTAVVHALTHVFSVEVIDSAFERHFPVLSTSLPETVEHEKPRALVTPGISPYLSAAVDLALEAPIEDEPAVDVLDLECSRLIDVRDINTVELQEHSGVSFNICNEASALETGITAALEVAQHAAVKPLQTPTTSDLDLFIEVPNLSLDTHDTTGDDEELSTSDVLLESVSKTVAFNTLHEDASIEEVVNATVEPLPRLDIVYQSLRSPIVDEDDEPTDPPPNTPLPVCLIVPVFVVRYICMVFVRSEIPRSFALQTSGPIPQPSVDARCVVLFRIRATLSGAQGRQKLVKETRCLVLRVSQTTVEVVAHDTHEVSHWVGSALVAHKSLSAVTLRLLKFLR